MRTNKILLTGGAGYIGSHTYIELINKGYEAIIFDNFCNSFKNILPRLELITKRTVHFVEGDIRNQDSIESVIKKYDCNSVIHFAGLKYIHESILKPLEYYDNNVIGTQKLLSAMRNTGIKKIIFSSSATVYGTPQNLPISETHALSPINPYGRSKLFVEWMLNDLFKSEEDWRIGILRYFNPAGAHSSGIIGEDPKCIPNNLLPLIGQVASRQKKIFSVLGSDYSTPDGTGIRDYIHVVDLALAHIKTLEHLETPEYLTLNLGTGKGYSVLEILKTFERISGKNIPYSLEPRRAGDVAACLADPSLAKKTINWCPKYTIENMCSDHWNWQQNHPSLIK